MVYLSLFFYHIRLQTKDRFVFINFVSLIK